MKGLKIFFILILSIALSFSLVSCNGESEPDGGDEDIVEDGANNTDNSEENSDNNTSIGDDDGNSENSDNGGADDDKPDGGGESSESESEKYISILTTSLREANTLRISVALDAELLWLGDGFDSEYSLNMLLAKTERGYNAKIELASEDGGFIPSASAYLVDDVVYIYSADGELVRVIHELESGGGIEGIELALSQLFYDALPNINGTQVTALVKNALITLFDSGAVIDGGSIVFETDFKDGVNSLIADINSVGAENVRVEDIVDSYLESVFPGITVDSVFDYIKQFGGVTLSELYEAVDAFLVGKVGLDLKTVYDGFINNESVLIALDMVGVDAVAAERLRTLDFDELLFKYGDMTLDDLFRDLTGESRATFKLAVGYIKAIVFSVNVSELFETLGLLEYLDVIKTLSAESLSQRLSFEIGEGFSLAGIFYDADFTVASDELSSKLVVDIDISRISEEKTEIVLPTV